MSKNNLDRNYVWECDYGVRKPLVEVLKKLLDEQNASQLQMVHMLVNENIYGQELYIVLSYDNPIEGQIQKMMNLMLSIGVKYRPDITHDELFEEMRYRRFNSITFVDTQMFDMEFNSMFNCLEREETLKNFPMRPLGKKMPVFISHTSRNKPEIEDFIPYLNGANLPIWYDKVSIDYGESIVKKVQQGIKDSGAVIFWITPDFLKSNWCNIEMESFLTRLSGENDILVLSVIHEDVDEDALPIFLTNKKYLKVNENMNLINIAQQIIPTLKNFYNDKLK